MRRLPQQHRFYHPMPKEAEIRRHCNNQILATSINFQGIMQWRLSFESIVHLASWCIGRVGGGRVRVVSRALGVRTMAAVPVLAAALGQFAHSFKKKSMRTLLAITRF